MTGPDPRRRLLALTVDHISRRGIADLSLRELATAIGTSHRMLIYHFGSKEELLVAVVQSVEASQRERLAELSAEAGDDPLVAMRRMWTGLTDPALAAEERLFFELYAQALTGRPGTTGLLDGIVDLWVDPATEQMLRAGVPEADARAEARLSLAIVRGLLLDLLATGDRAGVTAAFERHLAHLRTAV